jgi:hypothetical protein
MKSLPSPDGREDNAFVDASQDPSLMNSGSARAVDGKPNILAS